jgi:hypothetical protein
MTNGLLFDPSYYREQIKELNKGKYKREQPEETQVNKIAAAKLKRERKLLKGKK